MGCHSSSLREPARGATTGGTQQSTQAQHRHALPTQGPTEEFPWIPAQPRDSLHVAIKEENLALLRSMLEDHTAPLEERNEDGLTPLYHAVFCSWTDGALLLLSHGASVQNADLSLDNAGCGYFPLVHAAVRTQNITLLQKMLERGADINTLDSEGYHCMNSVKVDIEPWFRDVIFQQTANRPSREGDRPDTLKRLYSFSNASLHIWYDAFLARSIVYQQHPRDEKKMKRVLGAWLALILDYQGAVQLWEESRQSRQERQVERRRGFKSAFRDILIVDKIVFVRKETYSPDERLNIDTQALLYLEKYALTDKKLTFFAARLGYQLCERGETGRAFEVMHRLTTVRVLHKDEACHLVKTLDSIQQALGNQPHVPVSTIVHAVQIASNCVQFIAASNSFSNNSGLTTRHDLSTPIERCFLCSTLHTLLRTILRTLSLFFRNEDHASVEQTTVLLSDLKNFIHYFPWIRGQSLFHRLGPLAASVPGIASIIKTLVRCSVGAGQATRDARSPLLLAPDQNGDTPLHVLARHLRGKDLVDGQVLDCFVEHGARLFSRNEQGQSVLDLLTERGVFTEKCLHGHR